MYPCGRETLILRVKAPVNHVGADDMPGKGIRVAEEVCKSDGGEGIVVGKVLGVEFNHCCAVECQRWMLRLLQRMGWRMIILCIALIMRCACIGGEITRARAELLLLFLTGVKIPSSHL